jgi:hypothetical protein
MVRTPRIIFFFSCDINTAGLTARKFFFQKKGKRFARLFLRGDFFRRARSGRRKGRAAPIRGYTFKALYHGSAFLREPPGTFAGGSREAFRVYIQVAALLEREIGGDKRSRFCGSLHDKHAPAKP